ncbi:MULTISPECIES: hypothetical protein [unclassified Paenibacillus]|uniref:hypothetical protein n=1 Tax=unclassified Paenibacillus TaxID=185978 RepID=UPI002405E146|nr:MULTISPECIES: hypothetical protein [unclassified Paenibacillus]MDF9842708.1 ABC-2 type transport system permease protein [Paenibacillus sp. PastF-2]MDF9849424.1 ABC-2 type transport system permease protein [Paenibacillus sp. PastM-2]MDF9855868.1 ABC-2 type transport system permease protein [Paenibacillus sp. PastF-1]MDH6481266.1 ABC-2 type transport system permease protein [Paenibacillus sp. PastH-2]MDH6508685.1 ABC-2 type transport system permease protein [Paenibacillus sp. PastM-3]
MTIITLIRGMLSLHLRTTFEKNKKLSFRIIGSLYFFCIYFFVCRQVVEYMYGQAGQDSIPIIITGFFILSSSIILLFGTLPVISMFCFSNDILGYFHLPVKKQNIIFSKLIVLLLLEYFIIAALYIPIFWGIIQVERLPIFFYINSLIVILIIPIIPNTVHLTITMLFMKLLIRHKKKITITFHLMIYVVGTIFFLYILFINNKKNIMENVGIFEFWNGYINMHNLGFELIFHNKSSYYSLGGLIFVLIFLISILYLAVYILAVFYWPQNYEFLNAGIKVNVKSEIKILLTSRKELESLINLEFKSLLRRPVLFIKGVTSSFLFPILCTFLFVFNNQLEGIKVFIEQQFTYSFIFIVAYTVLILGWNIIAITSFSRDKKDLGYKLTMPISINKLIFAKIIVAWVYYFPAIVINALTFYFVFNLSPEFLIIWFFIAVLISLNGVMLCIIFDIWFPTVIWNDEHQLLKERTAITVFHVVNLIITLLIFLIGYACNNYSTENILLIVIVYFAVFFLSIITQVCFFIQKQNLILQNIINNDKIRKRKVG